MNPNSSKMYFVFQSSMAQIMIIVDKSNAEALERLCIFGKEKGYLAGDFGLFNPTKFAEVEEPSFTWDYPIVIPGKAEDGNIFIDIQIHVISFAGNARQVGITVHQAIKCILQSAQELWRLRED